MSHIGEFGCALAGVLTGGGLWSVLRIAVRGRAAVALERERAASATRMLERLPPGASFWEADGTGGCRRITLSDEGGAPRDEDDPR